MERKADIRHTPAIVFIYVVFIAGIVWHAIDPLLSLMLRMTSLTLFITGTLVLYYSVRKSGITLLYWVAGTYAVTLALEIIGVHTGYVFGSYEYGDVLKPTLMGVPLIIGYNWVFVVLGAAGIVQRYYPNRSPLFFGLLTGSLTVVFDIFLEPVAIALGYWTWSGVTVPLQNYAAWFAVSFGASYVLKRMRSQEYSSMAVHYFIAQGIFFVALNAVL
jgi:bisanhydrobacterioruberin hydratase